MANGRHMSCSPVVLFGAIAALIAAPAFAQDTGDHHEDAIVVTAIYARSQADLLSGTSVLSGEELDSRVRTTIGESLAQQAGVSATSFGPSASRPVLRGFQGDRVRVLTDGIGSFDVSATSVDHAVAINPLTAERIEVLRGPATLLFGSAAIGGVVNVIDARIPRRVPSTAFHLDAVGAYGSAAEERNVSGVADLKLSERFVVHVDGAYAKSDDLRAGGFVLAPALRAQAAQSGDPDVAALADLRGRIPNTSARNWNLAGGAALILSGGNVGFSVARIDSLYGVPLRYDVTGGSAAEAVRLDMRQTRFDLRGEINPANGVLEAIRFRGAAAKYRHDELEDTGAIGTSFFSDGMEGRLELVQREKDGWRGASGVQYLGRKVNVVGAEKFVPRNFASQLGVFTVQSFDFGAARMEAGARYEHARLSARADADLGTGEVARRFSLLSGSIGGNVELASGWRLGLNGSYAERAPSPEELFSNGPHAGTQAFELGDPALAKEKSRGLELTFRGGGADYNIAASVYHSWFDGFVYETATGGVEDGLPVFAYRQNNARHWGFEVEGAVTLARWGETRLRADALADYTRITINTVGPAPRIPPFRVLGGLELDGAAWRARVETEWTRRQNRIAAFETPTAGFTLVNASLSWHPFGEDNETQLSLSANNIFDVTARRHASFLKDYAPLAGRDIRVTARIAF